MISITSSTHSKLLPLYYLKLVNFSLNLFQLISMYKWLRVNLSQLSFSSKNHTHSRNVSIARLIFTSQAHPDNSLDSSKIFICTFITISSSKTHYASFLVFYFFFHTKLKFIINVQIIRAVCFVFATFNHSFVIFRKKKQNKTDPSKTLIDVIFPVTRVFVLSCSRVLIIKMPTSQHTNMLTRSTAYTNQPTNQSTASIQIEEIEDAEFSYMKNQR